MKPDGTVGKGEVLIETLWNVKFSGGDWISGGNSEY